MFAVVFDTEEKGKGCAVMSLQNICFSLGNPDLVIGQGGATSTAMSKHYSCYHCKHEIVQNGCALKSSAVQLEQ